MFMPFSIRSEIAENQIQTLIILVDAWHDLYSQHCKVSSFKAGALISKDKNQENRNGSLWTDSSEEGY